MILHEPLQSELLIGLKIFKLGMQVMLAALLGGRPPVPLVSFGEAELKFGLKMYWKAGIPRNIE